jgi:hypothetical protein
MTVQAVFFDMGGTLETFGWTPELRLQQTAASARSWRPDQFRFNRPAIV